MNRFLLNLTLILTAVIFAACSADVSINTTDSDSGAEGTIPAAAAVDSSEPMTDSETIGSEITDSVAMTETTAMTATAVPAVTLEATAVPTDTDGTTSEGTTLTVTETMSTESMTDTATVTETGTVTDTDAMTATAASTPDMTTLPDTSDMTVAEVVASLDAFSTLASVVNTLGITDALSAPGPITVFAPVNEAFDVIPDEQLQGLLADPELLAGILQYHIIIDAADSAELARLNAAQSTSGQPLTITVGLNGEVFVNEAQIVFADIPVSNGVIHVINQVLVPPTIGLSLPVADPTTIALMADAEDETLEALKAEDTSDMTVLEVVGSISGLSTAATAIDAAGLTDVLEQPGPFTLFVPTNPAFDQLPDNQLADLLNDSVALADVLQYHLVLDTVTSGDLATLPSLLNAAGDTITVVVEDDGQIFINNAPVYQIDIEASNGIVHVVGEVITPVPEQ